MIKVSAVSESSAVTSSRLLHNELEMPTITSEREGADSMLWHMLQPIIVWTNQPFTSVIIGIDMLVR